MPELIDVPDEAVRLATGAFALSIGEPDRPGLYQLHVQNALAEVLPVLRAQIEAEIRAKIAEAMRMETEAHARRWAATPGNPDFARGVAYGFSVAANVARGETNG